MSIPKEPRQLMINIMYLVLTALLALNVSAEIFNAFKLVNKGLEKSNQALDRSNSALPEIIKERSKKKKELATYAERVDPARALSAEMVEYVQGIVDEMINLAGDKSEDGKVTDEDYVIKLNEDGTEKKRELKGKKNKDVTTRYLVYTEEEGGQGQGAVLKQKILDYKKKFLDLIDEADRPTFANEIAISIDDESWKAAKKKSWSEFNFRQMPLAATIPIFTKMQNDAKATEAAVLNYLLGKVGGEDIVLDKFQVYSSPTKSYIIKGEKFETEISLGASASNEVNTGISISVDGRRLSVNKDGAAAWSQSASSVGVKKYNASVSVTNAVTEETKTYKKTFEYEVGERSCNVSAVKMNVFYIGVKNPVAVSAAGISSNELKVSASGSGASLVPGAKGQYDVTVKTPGKANITVSGGGLEATKFEFRVKKIPDPVAELTTGESSGDVKNGIFRAQKGVIANLKNFDFDARCKIQGFRLVRAPKRQDVEIETNRTGTFSSSAKSLVSKAKAGDRYFFENVKAKCPGDQVARTINAMTFNIK